MPVRWLHGEQHSLYVSFHEQLQNNSLNLFAGELADVAGFLFTIFTDHLHQLAARQSLGSSCVLAAGELIQQLVAHLGDVLATWICIRRQR